MKAKLETIIKKNIIINKLFTIVGSFFMRVLSVFVPMKNRVLFVSNMGKFIGDSPYVLYQKMISDPFFSEYEMYWAVENPEDYRFDNVVKIDTLKYFILALSSKIWITNVNVERGLHFKKKETVYLNTWHGIPLKYIGNDVKGRSDYDFSSINIFCVSGDYEKNIYSRAFKLKKESMCFSGLPRNEKLMFGNGIHKSNNNNKKNIVLYAPTWRDYEDSSVQNAYLDLKKLIDYLGNNYILLVRRHPLDRFPIPNDQNILDVSNHDNLEELMIKSDFLISDYSSIMIDYAWLGKPIFSYVPDYDIYKQQRGLYVEKDKIAPNVFSNQDDLMEAILNIDQNKETKKTNKYLEYFVHFDISKTVPSDIILEKLKLEVEKVKEFYDAKSTNNY